MAQDDPAEFFARQGGEFLSDAGVVISIFSGLFRVDPPVEFTPGWVENFSKAPPTLHSKVRAALERSPTLEVALEWFGYLRSYASRMPLEFDPKSDVEKQNLRISAAWSAEHTLREFPEDLMKSSRFQELAPPYPRMPSDVYARLSTAQRMEIGRWASHINGLRLATFKAKETGDPDNEYLALFDHLRATFHVAMTARIADMVGVRLDTRVMTQEENTGSAWRATLHQSFSVPASKRPRWVSKTSRADPPAVTPVSSVQKNGPAPSRPGVGRGRPFQQPARKSPSGEAVPYGSKNGRR
jgi:hypothetical protein